MVTKKIIVGNWKLYVTKIEQAKRLFSVTKKAVSHTSGVEVIICPPFVLVPLANTLLKGSVVRVGAQNLFWEHGGAFTGEVGTHILKDYGVEFVIVGHSERRYFFDETNDIVAKKLQAAMEGGLKAILCVGERIRSGDWKQFLLRQVLASTKNIKKSAVHNLIVAYEPVWAIGTGRADTPHNAEESIREIRKVLARRFGKNAVKNVRILYGGSVTPGNVNNFLLSPEIDGVLVGRASTIPKDFSRIIKITAGGN